MRDSKWRCRLYMTSLPMGRKTQYFTNYDYVIPHCCLFSNTIFTLAPWPWPSKVRRGSRQGSSVNTHLSELFCSYVLYVFKGKFGEGLDRLNVNGIVQQQCMICRASVNQKARPAMAKLARAILAKAWSG